LVEFSNYIKKNSFTGKIIQSAVSILFVAARYPFAVHKHPSNEVLVISLHNLGDTVFTIPAIRALKNEFKDRLTIVCYEDSRSIYELIFNNFKYVIADKNDFYFNGRIAKSKIREKIKDINPGTIIDLTGAINSATLIFNSTADSIIGFNEAYFKKIYTGFIPKRKVPHLFDLYLDIVKEIIPVENDGELKDFGYSYKPDGYIIVHPFGGWAAKEWDFYKFVELTEKLNNSFKCIFIIPKDRAKGSNFQLIQSKNISYLILDQISELINAIKDCTLLIGNDSGAVYIASLLGKPTFTIYGPTNPRYSLPVGSHHEFIQKTIHCSAGHDEQYCYLDAGRKCPSYECMKQLPVNEVFIKINSFLEKNIYKLF